MDKTTIIGVQLGKRIETAKTFQEVISKHGCIIKSRIGLHHVENGKCSPSGVILLDVIGDSEEIAALEKDINAIEFAEIKKMEFVH